MQREFPLKVGTAEADCDELNAHIFREPHFGFLEDFFQAGKTGEWKLTDRNGADLANRRLVQRRATAFFMDQYEHPSSSLHDVEKTRQLCSRVAYCLNVLRSTPRHFARCGLAWNKVRLGAPGLGG
jgi:hypothetical protein